eukprot:CAMPEP_0202876214 /NCGR_PEP_ID=MMETSP1391-20130828/28660_1 /ASSEMBLY_ACC=CAM_ASM_000867 /TAXON_ID=1034604 /ORGANISM="Chlamydomonas leiostraca, Strain SAG 11-49" /LENGTH=180 /DNA_ID=CAMNT_0049558013 /DNA_START=33 /DNA_END=575 /DNA_ORIENTATION=+
MICLWEMSLFFHRKLIRSQYLSMKRKYEGKLPSPMFMFEHVSFLEALTLKHWAKVWSTYSLMDPSYSELNSFGFAIDCGNAFTAIIPSILLALSCTWDIMPAKTMGLVGIISNYQMLYGTVLYFFSYVINERWKGRPGLALVIASNGVWIAGPLLSMYACYIMLSTNSYAIVREGPSISL